MITLKNKWDFFFNLPNTLGALKVNSKTHSHFMHLLKRALAMTVYVEINMVAFKMSEFLKHAGYGHKELK